MPKIIFGFEFDTETKIFKQIGNTDALTAMRILLDVVNEMVKPKTEETLGRKVELP